MAPPNSWRLMDLNTDDHSSVELSDGNVDDLGINWNGVLKNPRPGDSQVLFYWEGVKNEKRSREAGHPVYEPVEFLSIKSRDGLSVVTRRATDKDIEMYPMQFKRFKKTDQKIDGLPLKEWPPITRVQMMNLNAAGIRSVEQLRDASEEKLNFLGSEGRQLQEQAQAYFEGATDASKVIRQSKENSELRANVESLKVQLSAANAQIQDLQTRGHGQAMPQQTYQPVAPQFDMGALVSQITEQVKASLVVAKPERKGWPKGKPRKVQPVSTEGE